MQEASKSADSPEIYPVNRFRKAMRAFIAVAGVGLMILAIGAPRNASAEAMTPPDHSAVP